MFDNTPKVTRSYRILAERRSYQRTLTHQLVTLEHILRQRQKHWEYEAGTDLLQQVHAPGSTPYQRLQQLWGSYQIFRLPFGKKPGGRSFEAYKPFFFQASTKPQVVFNQIIAVARTLVRIYHTDQLKKALVLEYRLNQMDANIYGTTRQRHGQVPGTMPYSAYLNPGEGLRLSKARYQERRYQQVAEARAIFGSDHPYCVKHPSLIPPRQRLESRLQTLATALAATEPSTAVAPLSLLMLSYRHQWFWRQSEAVLKFTSDGPSRRAVGSGHSFPRRRSYGGTRRGLLVLLDYRGQQALLALLAEAAVHRRSQAKAKQLKMNLWQENYGYTQKLGLHPDYLMVAPTFQFQVINATGWSAVNPRSKKFFVSYLVRHEPHHSKMLAQAQALGSRKAYRHRGSPHRRRLEEAKQKKLAFQKTGSVENRLQQNQTLKILQKYAADVRTKTTGADPFSEESRWRRGRQLACGIYYRERYAPFGKKLGHGLRRYCQNKAFYLRPQRINCLPGPKPSFKAFKPQLQPSKFKIGKPQGYDLSSASAGKDGGISGWQPGFPQRGLYLRWLCHIYNQRHKRQQKQLFYKVKLYGKPGIGFAKGSHFLVKDNCPSLPQPAVKFNPNCPRDRVWLARRHRQSYQRQINAETRWWSTFQKLQKASGTSKNFGFSFSLLAEVYCSRRHQLSRQLLQLSRVLYTLVNCPPRVHRNPRRTFLPKAFRDWLRRPITALACYYISAAFRQGEIAVCQEQFLGNFQHVSSPTFHPKPRINRQHRRPGVLSLTVFKNAKSPLFFQEPWLRWAYQAPLFRIFNQAGTRRYWQRRALGVLQASKANKPFPEALAEAFRCSRELQAFSGKFPATQELPSLVQRVRKLPAFNDEPRNPPADPEGESSPLPLIKAPIYAPVLSYKNPALTLTPALQFGGKNAFFVDPTLPQNQNNPPNQLYGTEGLGLRVLLKTLKLVTYPNSTDLFQLELPSNWRSQLLQAAEADRYGYNLPCGRLPTPAPPEGYPAPWRSSADLSETFAAKPLFLNPTTTIFGEVSDSAFSTIKASFLIQNQTKEEDPHSEEILEGQNNTFFKHRKVLRRCRRQSEKSNFPGPCRSYGENLWKACSKYFDHASKRKPLFGVPGMHRQVRRLPSLAPAPGINQRRTRRCRKPKISKGIFQKRRLKSVNPLGSITRLLPQAPGKAGLQRIPRGPRYVGMRLPQLPRKALPLRLYQARRKALGRRGLPRSRRVAFQQLAHIYPQAVLRRMSLLRRPSEPAQASFRRLRRRSTHKRIQGRRGRPAKKRLEHQKWLPAEGRSRWPMEGTVHRRRFLVGYRRYTDRQRRGGSRLLAHWRRRRKRDRRFTAGGFMSRRRGRAGGYRLWQSRFKKKMFRGLYYKITVGLRKGKLRLRELRGRWRYPTAVAPLRHRRSRYYVRPSSSPVLSAETSNPFRRSAVTRYWGQHPVHGFRVPTKLYHYGWRQDCHSSGNRRLRAVGVRRRRRKRTSKIKMAFRQRREEQRLFRRKLLGKNWYVG